MGMLYGKLGITNRIFLPVSVPEVDFDVSSLHSEKRRLLRKNAGPAFGFMPDDGSGKVSGNLFCYAFVW